MAVKPIAVCFGTALLLLQATQGWTAQVQVHAVPHGAHNAAAASSGKHEIAPSGKDSGTPSVALKVNRNSLVSVGPQAAIQRIRALAMAPTG
jgi:hypothetical protein